MQERVVVVVERVERCFTSARGVELQSASTARDERAEGL